MPPASDRLFAKGGAMAEKEGIILVIENEHICWGDTADNTRKLIQKVDSIN